MGSTSAVQLHKLFRLNPDLVVGVEVAFILVVQAISKGRGHLVHHLSFIGVEVPEGRLAAETPRETAMTFKGCKGTGMSLAPKMEIEPTNLGLPPNQRVFFIPFAVDLLRASAHSASKQFWKLIQKGSDC